MSSAAYLERRGPRARLARSQERAERVVLGVCGAMLVAWAALGWLSGGGA